MQPKSKLTLILVVLLIGFMVFLFGFRRVKAGTVRVVLRFGKPTGRVLQPGANWIIPLVDSTVKYNTKKVIYEVSHEFKHSTSEADYKDYPVNTTTEDGQGVILTYTIRFRVDPTKVIWLVENVGRENDIIEKVVKTESRSWTRTIVRDFTSLDLYSGNIREVQDKIYDTLLPKFADNGILLDELLLREPKFDSNYEAVMESKQVELERVKVEEHKAEQEKFKKEQRITAAEGQAAEQELQRLTLTDALLQKMWIERWNGILPQTMCGENSSFLLQVDQ